MSFSPVAVGDASVIHCTFTQDGGSIFALTGLSNANFAMHFVSSSGVLRVGTGSWTITSTTNGTADYAPSSADVATADTYKIYPVLTLATGAKAFDAQTLVINYQP